MSGPHLIRGGGKRRPFPASRAGSCVTNPKCEHARKILASSCLSVLPLPPAPLGLTPTTVLVENRSHGSDWAAVWDSRRPTAGKSCCCPSFAGDRALRAAPRPCAITTALTPVAFAPSRRKKKLPGTRASCWTQPSAPSDIGGGGQRLSISRHHDNPPTSCGPPPKAPPHPGGRGRCPPPRAASSWTPVPPTPLARQPATKRTRPPDTDAAPPPSTRP
jgi:hypothetical protein